MKDLHNHILFGIDDGSNNIEESIKIIEEAEKNGYTDLILTPHYRKLENFTSDNKSKRKRFKKLKKELEERNINVNIYLGNEITLDEAISILKRDTRHFAKRQLTWFRREKEVIWLDKSTMNQDELLQYIEELFHKMKGNE